MEAALWTICDGHIFIEFDQLNCFLLNLGAGSYFAKISYVDLFSPGIHVKTGSGKTVLHHAAENNSVESMRFLIEEM